MSYIQPAYLPPPIPPKLTAAHNFQDLRDGVKEYLQQNETFTRNYITQLAANHNKNANGFSPDDVAAATTIQVDGNLQQIVTGTAAIETITPPAKFNGFKELYAANGFSLVTGGNIATAITVPAGEVVLLSYFPPTQLWGVVAAFFTGTLPDNSVGPAQLQANAVTTPALAASAVTTAKIAANAVTTPLLASGAATEGTSFTDNTTDNITPYGTPVTIISGTVTVNAATDFVSGSVTIDGTSANIQSDDQLAYTILRGATSIATGTLKLTLSTSTIVGGVWASTIAFEDSGISGSQTYSVQLTTTNGSGNTTFAVSKTAASLQIVDHKAQ
jgi:hypothetical protein